MKEEKELLKEIQSDLRKDFVKGILKKYFKHITAAIVVIAVVAGGYLAYSAYTTDLAKKNSFVFYAAKEKLEAGETLEAMSLLAGLVSKGTNGYAFIAYMEQAALELEDGKEAAAVAILQEAQKNVSLPSYYSNLMQTIEFSLRMNDDADTNLQNDIKLSLNKKNIFYYNNLEMHSALLIKNAQYQEAMTGLEEITAAEKAPADVKDRAGRIRNLIAGYIG